MRRLQSGALNLGKARMESLILSGEAAIGGGTRPGAPLRGVPIDCQSLTNFFFSFSTTLALHTIT